MPSPRSVEHVVEAPLGCEVASHAQHADRHSILEHQPARDLEGDTLPVRANDLDLVRGLGRVPAELPLEVPPSELAPLRGEELEDVLPEELLG